MKTREENEYGGIPELIDALYSENGQEREHARLMLIARGKHSTLFLIRTLESQNSRARWEAVEALRYIADPIAATVLVQVLKDDIIGNRWAAANALIALQRATIYPLLNELTHDFSSIWLRDGARHILNAFHDIGLLTSFEEQVYKKLHGPAQDMAVPWAAELALESLRGSQQPFRTHDLRSPETETGP